ncbi:MAG: MATE family efflux transporter [Candidatus Metalachnospira sp.]|nr:MATE family efflux transporter [Candidatus Metalachnospira sp.]
MKINKNFYMSIFAIAIPIALQNLISLGTSMMDTVMLGRADGTGILLSASSLANQPFFILQVLTFGVASGSSVLCAQYWGKGDIKSIRDIFSFVLKIAIAIGIIFGIIVLTIPEKVMGLYSNNSEIIMRGAEYLRILGYAYFTFAISNTVISALRSIEVLRVSVISSLVSFFTNVFLNWVLIFGNLGAPRMGIKGAAIATLIARLLEFIIAMVYLLVIDKRLQFKLKDMLIHNKTLAGDVVKNGTPVVINEFMWSVATSVQAAILGHITYSAGNPVAANSIAGVIQQLSTVIILGVANAAAVLVGMAIGENNMKKAEERANALKRLSIVMGVIACAFILSVKSAFIGFYDVPAETKVLANEIITVFAFITIFTSINMTLIMGTLRGAGDTKFCMKTEMTCLWLVAIPLAFIAAFVFQLPVPIVFLLMKLDEPSKAIICIIRMRGTKWLNSLTRNFE